MSLLCLPRLRIASIGYEAVWFYPFLWRFEIVFYNLVWLLSHQIEETLSSNWSCLWRKMSLCRNILLNLHYSRQNIYSLTRYGIVFICHITLCLKIRWQKVILILNSFFSGQWNNSSRCLFIYKKYNLREYFEKKMNHLIYIIFST